MSAKKSFPPHFLAKWPRYFGLYWSANHETFIIHWAAKDANHPMATLRRRVMGEREKKGLWWHVTVGINTSKTRVVRSWVKRRLRNAFLEALKERGVAEDGKIVNPSKLLQSQSIIRAIEQGQQVALTGSVKMHALADIVTAKYVDVKEETSALVDALLKGLEADLAKEMGKSPLHPLQPHRKKPSDGIFSRAVAPKGIPRAKARGSETMRWTMTPRPR
jgi:hypothetical protein